MKDKLDELHYIYKMIGNYGFCTVQELLEKYNKQLDNWNKLKEYVNENLYFYSGLQREDLETDFSIQMILNKMQEIERSDNNDANR